MSAYDWDHNCAVVDRLFYWEYFIKGTTAIVVSLTMKDLWFIRVNWYADRAYKRLPVYWALWAGINLLSGWFLVWPLTSEEIKKQWLKKQAIGKFNYSLAFLDLEEDRKEWSQELEKKRLIAAGEIYPDNHSQH